MRGVSSSLRLAFAGSPEVALPTLEALVASRHEVVVAISRADSPRGRRRTLTPTPVSERAEALGIPVVKTDRLDAAATERVLDFAPDLGVIVAYGGMVREPLLSTPRLGWINLHFSLLPRWRGAAPVQHAIMAGDASTGVSVFQLVPELDAGPVYAQVEEPVGRFQTAGSLLAELAELGARVTTDVVDALADGTAVGVTQEGAPTFAGKLGIADGELDWSRSSEELDRVIRGVTPEPGAWTMFEGERFKILEAAVARDAAVIAPGHVILDGKRVLVGTGSGSLELVTVHPAGKKAMPATAWLRGRQVAGEVVLG